MTEPKDAVLPILQKIQQDVGEGFRKSDVEFKRLDAKLNDVAETVTEIQQDISEIRRENLMHLGLTTRHRMAYDDLRVEIDDLKSRLATLESRS
jgi:FtsZ-binding cell division protein ZapB